MDTVKEALLDELGAFDVEGPRSLGKATVTILLALATESGGAVLEAPWRRDRAADVAALPGRVVEVSCRVDQVAEPVAAGWPVLEQDTVGPVSMEALARLVRQVAGGTSELDANARDLG